MSSMSRAKRAAALTFLRLMLPKLRRDAHPLNRLLADAVQLQSGRSTDENFRKAVERFYAEVDRWALLESVGLERLRKRLDRPGGYKADIRALAENGAGGADDSKPSPLNFWGRRFGLLRHIGVRLDVLILREGEQIPPHGHYGVVSGFYVLEGEVAFRHYDRIRESGEAVFVRKSVDMVAGPGGFAANSEFHQNIHWLCGAAPASYLFRVTAAGAPVKTFGDRREKNERVYVDPTGPADGEGLILAPYIGHDAAQRLPFHVRDSAVSAVSTAPSASVAPAITA
jgi:hypothetical protein